MKLLHKYSYWLASTFLLIAIVLYGFSAAQADSLGFCVSNDTVAEEISVFDAGDGNWYAFLPSYANLEQVIVVMRPKQQISLNGIELWNGMTCEDFELNTAYPLEIDGRDEANLWFCQSSNVATMYVNTVTGSMEYIHKDKDYEENAAVTIYTVDGEVNFRSDGNTLKGRGNATWGYDKHPYSLTLSYAADLLGMGSATNWVLLANATDETNLNNYLVYDLASRVGFFWSPECKFIDVYLNGEYNGLYLLAEKIEIDVNRLNINPTSGDFLCKFELNKSWDTLRNPLLTDSGRIVEISYPETLSQTDYEHISFLVNQMEKSILSGTDLNATPIVDLDSWIRRYLIDEISGNIDSDLGSSYFYYSDEVFYAGPVWDYDMSFGNCRRNQEPNAFLAKNAQKSPLYLSPYYSMLYENPSFYNRMIEIYRQEFWPVLQRMVDGEIEALSISISNAAQMNSIRWKAMYDMLQGWEQEIVCNTTDLLAYIERRFAFCNHAWLENTDYCTVQFDFTSTGMYWSISVPRGSYLETSYVDLGSTIWIDSSTQEVFDFNQPVMADAILILQTEEVAMPSENAFATRDYVVFLSIATLLVLFAWVVTIDLLHRK